MSKCQKVSSQSVKKRFAVIWKKNYVKMKEALEPELCLMFSPGCWQLDWILEM